MLLLFFIAKVTRSNKVKDQILTALIFHSINISRCYKFSCNNGTIVPRNNALNRLDCSNI